jgi:hypothetical protein
VENIKNDLTERPYYYISQPTIPYTYIYDKLCRFFSIFEVIFYNYVFFVIPFFIGCNFTHLVNVSWLSSFSLTSKPIKKWRCPQWFLATFILINWIYILYTLNSESQQRFLIYAGLATVMVVLFIKRKHIEKAFSKLFRLNYYVLAMCLCPLIALHGVYMAMLLAIVSGIMVEGASRLGTISFWNNEDIININEVNVLPSASADFMKL